MARIIINYIIIQNGISNYKKFEMEHDLTHIKEVKVTFGRDSKQNIVFPNNDVYSRAHGYFHIAQAFTNHTTVFCTGKNGFNFVSHLLKGPRTKFIDHKQHVEIRPDGKDMIIINADNNNMVILLPYITY